MKITNIGHIVLTVKDIDKSVDFYQSILGMTAENFVDNRTALEFVNQEINLHK